MAAGRMRRRLHRGIADLQVLDARDLSSSRIYRRTRSLRRRHWGYYLDNAYLIGAAHPFQWQGSWANLYLAYKYTNSPKPSHDPQFSLYWGKGFSDRWDFASTAVGWTQNKNHGDASTANLSGKRFAFLVENEIWYKPFANISVGSEIRVSYNGYATDGRLLIYPTIGTRYLF